MRTPALLFAIVCALSAPEARAGTAALVIEVVGTQPIGVRIAAGTTAPCTSPDNQPLFAGVMKPSEPLSIATDAVCVCVQQTIAPFVASGWNDGTIRCRPIRHVGKRQYVDLTSPFRITLSSKGP
ncbi:MAG: hypothetical protein ACXVEF_27960 [Polyangiales bacterium]